jgi:hypothetical protein
VYSRRPRIEEQLEHHAEEQGEQQPQGELQVVEAMKINILKTYKNRGYKSFILTCKLGWYIS